MRFGPCIAVCFQQTEVNAQKIFCVKNKNSFKIKNCSIQNAALRFNGLKNDLR